MRPRLAVGSIALVGAVCAGAATTLEVRAANGGSPSDAGAVSAPILSVRRMPDVLARPAALDALRRDLAAWAVQAPPDSCAMVSTLSGEPLLDLRAGALRVPASTLKLVTATLALEVLGPDHRVPGPGAPVADLLRPLISESDNAVATALFDELRRVVGAPELLQRVRRLGPGFEDAVVVDGTGRSHDNRISCRALVEVLRREGTGAVVREHLAVAGRSGTLANVFVGTPLVGVLHAKTGSLATVSALAGVVDDGDGPLVFAFIVDAPEGVDEAAVLAQQLALGRALVAWSPAAVAERLGPVATVP